MLDPSERAALRKKQKLLFDTGHLSIQGGGGSPRSKMADAIRLTALVLTITAVTALVTYWLA
jgi:hypothetical protein